MRRNIGNGGRSRYLIAHKHDLSFCKNKMMAVVNCNMKMQQNFSQLFHNKRATEFISHCHVCYIRVFEFEFAYVCVSELRYSWHTVVGICVIGSKPSNMLIVKKKCNCSFFLIVG